jgi:hypothetical protein
VERLAAKRAARDELFEMHGWKKSKRAPVVAFVTQGAKPAVLTALREGLEHLELHLLELKSAEPAAFLGVDIAVFPASELEVGQTAAAALRAGAVPVVFEKSAPKAVAAEYNPTDEQGNSFYFRHESAWAIFAALVRATETYRFPYDWQGIVRNTFSKS